MSTYEPSTFVAHLRDMCDKRIRNNYSIGDYLNLVDEAADRIEQLERELAKVEAAASAAPSDEASKKARFWDQWSLDDCKYMSSAYLALRAELNAAKADAERYRKYGEHYFITPKADTNDPCLERCAQCGFNLRDPIHERVAIERTRKP